ncbi:MAG: AAA family ATPase [Actinobacteria bacterium]|nr:AAA family ATPase [Actinomycetota bacterium]
MPVCPSCGAQNPEGSRFCNACGARLDAAASQPGEQREPVGERRVVTMLFCDVRGSTAMAETLDAEEWTDVMNLAYEQLIEPVIRHEGTVARLMGDAILAFFGAPTAHEDDPQRAVMAGLEIVSGIGPLRERLARERGLDLNVRVGINTGSVVVGQVGSSLRQEYTAMGDAVNVAARMEQTAEPGTVQIAEDTYRLVADLFDVQALGAIELKGKREPVSAYRVRGRLDAPWKVRAARSLEATLVGRETEIAVVRSAIERVREGVGSVVLIVGEPGIGKSRLLEEANALWAGLGSDGESSWDYWYCVPHDAMQPYAQYRRLIRERAGIVDGDPAEVMRTKIEERMRRVANLGSRERRERVARALLGIERDDEERIEGEAFRREVTELAIEWNLALAGPRLIVFEDLHWCDQASLDLAKAITRLALDHPFAFLITLRPDRNAPSWAFREWVASEFGERAVPIDLQPLTEGESARLIDEVLPVVEMPADLRRQILEKTEGNPLFVQEVARSLIDGGAVERDGDGLRLADRVAELEIPGSIQSLITVGLDRLPERTRRTLQAAAVIGRTFEEDVLRAVVGNGDVRDDLDELERRDLIRAAAGSVRPPYTFRHALTQEAAYESLLVKDRRSVHLRVAHGLEAASAERLEEVASVLTHHFGRAGDDEATLRYALLAADAAARLYANAEAEAHYRTALDVGLRIGADSDLVRSAFARRGNALELAGRHLAAAANYEEMREVARGRRDEEMELAASGSLALLYSTATPLFDVERGRRLSEENAETARRLGDRAAEARALWNILVASVYGGGDPGLAVEAGEESLALARTLGDREQVAFTLNDLGRAYLQAGDYATAAERLEEARGLWEELDNLPMLGDALAVSGHLRLLVGDHAGAMEQARIAVADAARIGNRWGESHALLMVYRVEFDLGDLGAAISSMERCRDVGGEGGFAYAGVAARADLARVYAYLGDGERALSMAEEALGIAREQAPTTISVAIVGQAEARLAIGDLEGARTELARLEDPRIPEPDRLFALVWAGLARARLALAAGEGEEAAGAVEQVLGLLRANEVEILVAPTEVALARARIAQGRFDEAERALAHATRRAERLGESLPLWEALALTAEVLDRRGAEGEAADARRRAREIVHRVAAGIPDEGLRRSFLAREDVVALGERN